MSGQTLYSCLSTLVDMSESGQRRARDKYHDISPKQLLNEFQTIRLKTARRSGHTYAVAELLKKRFNSIIHICASRAMSEVAKREFTSHVLGMDEAKGMSPKEIVSYFKKLDDRIRWEVLDKNLSQLRNLYGLSCPDAIVIEMPIIGERLPKALIDRIIVPMVSHRKDPFFLIMVG